MVDACRDRSVPPHVLHRQRPVPGRCWARSGRFDHQPENEWDLAAGVLLIEESGGTISDGTGKPFIFNQPTPGFRGVIAVASTADNKLYSKIGRAHV